MRLDEEKFLWTSLRLILLFDTLIALKLEHPGEKRLFSWLNDSGRAQFLFSTPFVLHARS